MTTDAPSLGPYRLLESLGQGGMGVVYRARHSVTSRAVALKTVRLSTPRWNESIRREVDALTRIRHPGVVRILDHGVHEGRPWYAMELLEGESLRDFGSRIWSPYRNRQTPCRPTQVLTSTDLVSSTIGSEDPGVQPPPRPLGTVPVAAGALAQVLALMRRACATLAYLHGEGIVSCDLKPENALIVGATPVLIDFGLSRRFPASTGREAIDVQLTLAGTLPYMSPEQLNGELVDARSDLYSIGCILYELLTGAPPFNGAPYSIRAQHLTVTPAPLSELVDDVPPALEALVDRLLQKAPNDRVGFADEVADALSVIGGETERLHEFPPARPYLYRPRFLGRSAVMETTLALRDRTWNGVGSLVLIGGESGVGKTRLALEVARKCATARLRVVASESVPIASDAITSSSASPLYAVRPILRAIADRCQEGGPETTERLLGERRSLLAAYEPLLAAVPSATPLTPPPELAPPLARKRLLRYLADTLSAFAWERPILWIVDDLGWADDLSVAFLRSLTEEYLATTPALIFVTYRTEEAPEAVRGLALQPHVTRIDLERLEPTEVSAMVADMLAASPEDTSFTDYVAQAAEGNPFFVTEHVRAAVIERLFYRDQSHAWRMRAPVSAGGENYGELPLPRSLRELVERRLRALSEIAQQVARAAAVLGREVAMPLVHEVAGLSTEAMTAAIDELIRRQVLEQSSAERLRFAHDKLRESAYSGTAAELSSLHARAAAALERDGRDRVDAADSWATIGHHHAAAGHPEQAGSYFWKAADHARSNFANSDAIALYRRAVGYAREVLARSGGDGPARTSMLLELNESLGDVLALAGRHDQARAAYQDTTEYVQDVETVVQARLRRKIGHTLESAGNHTQALRFYAAAKDLLQSVPEVTMARTRDEWILVRFDALRANYWLARSEEMDAIVSELRPIVEAYGTPQQLAGFYESQMFYRLARERYAVSDATLALSEFVLRVCGVEGAPERAWAHFQHGFALLHSTRPEDAEQHLATSLQLSARVGDIVNQARAALYLAVATRLRGDVDEVAALSARAAKMARDAGMRQYVAAAKAIDAWVCARRQDMQGALRFAKEAIADWSAYEGVYPFQWLALIPRLEVHLALGEIPEAIDSCRSLLLPEQRRLPQAVENPLVAAIASWDEADKLATLGHLASALHACTEHALR